MDRVYPGRAIVPRPTAERVDPRPVYFGLPAGGTTFTSWIGEHVRLVGFGATECDPTRASPQDACGAPPGVTVRNTLTLPIVNVRIEDPANPCVSAPGAYTDYAFFLFRPYDYHVGVPADYQGLVRQELGSPALFDRGPGAGGEALVGIAAGLTTYGWEMVTGLDDHGNREWLLSQLDPDGDGTWKGPWDPGANAANDPDGDGLRSDLVRADGTPHDNCPDVFNPGDEDGHQADIDGDGVGDACDTCPRVPNAGAAQTQDTDGDGVPDACDICPTVPNADQSDDETCYVDGVPEPHHGDGIGDACDNCPGACNADQANRNADAEIAAGLLDDPAHPELAMGRVGVGDACDPVPCGDTTLDTTQTYQAGGLLETVAQDQVRVDALSTGLESHVVFGGFGSHRCRVVTTRPHDRTGFRFCPCADATDDSVLARDHCKTTDDDTPLCPVSDTDAYDAGDRADIVAPRDVRVRLSASGRAGPRLRAGRDVRPARGRRRVRDGPPRAVDADHGRRPLERELRRRCADRLHDRPRRHAGGFVDAHSGAGNRRAARGQSTQSREPLLERPHRATRHGSGAPTLHAFHRSVLVGSRLPGLWWSVPEGWLVEGTAPAPVPGGCADGPPFAAPEVWLGPGSLGPTGVFGGDPAPMIGDISGPWLAAPEPGPFLPKEGLRYAAIAPDGSSVEQALVQTSAGLVPLASQQPGCPNPPCDVIPPPTDPPPPRSDFLAVLSARRVLVWVGGGIGPSGAPVRDLWAYDVRTADWRQLPLPATGPAPERVLAATYAPIDDALWVLDVARADDAPAHPDRGDLHHHGRFDRHRTDDGRFGPGHVGRLRLLRVDALGEGVTVVGRWPARPGVTRYAMAPDAAGGLFVASSGDEGRAHTVVRLVVGPRGVAATGFATGHGAVVPNAIHASAAGVTLIVRDGRGRPSLVGYRTEDLRPAGPGIVGRCL